MDPKRKKIEKLIKLRLDKNDLVLTVVRTTFARAFGD